MEEWGRYNIVEIVTTNVEQLSAKDDWEKALYLDPGNITENSIEYIQELPISKLPSRARRKVKDGDVVFSTVRPNQRYCGYISNPSSNMLVSTGFAVLSDKQNIINSKFLYYWLCRNEIVEYLQNIAEQTVSAYPSIKDTDICELEIELPPLAVQWQIASILSFLDSKIELNRRINDNLEQQSQAFFKSWFVDFEPFGGMIPKGWRVGTLDEIGDIIGSGTLSKAEDIHYCTNGIAWITPKDLSVQKAKFVSKGEIDITEEGYYNYNSSAKRMPTGSILFSSRAPIGYVSIALNEFTTNQDFKSVVPTKAGTCFIYLYLKEQTPCIEAQATGSTFKEASGTLMKVQEIVIPKRSVLYEFEALVKPILKSNRYWKQKTLFGQSKEIRFSQN